MFLILQLYVKGIKLQHVESLEEKKWVMTCNSLLICIFAMNGLHFLMLSEGIREHYFALSVGVQLGLIMSGVIYLGIGFFTDSQHESHFLRCLALTFKLVGFLLYSLIACVILLLCYLELEG